MEWPIWNPSYFQVARNRNYCEGQGWLCDFYFGYGHDVIEENALNENFCIEVLRILVMKADTEIVELEEDLAILRSQLVWGDEELSDLCSCALREKIDRLDILTQSLKSNNVEHEQGLGVCLQLPRGPAERVDDILHALLKTYLRRRDEQSADAIARETISDDTRHATVLLVDMNGLINSGSDSTGKNEVRETTQTPPEKQLVFDSSSKTTEKKTIDSGTVKSADELIDSRSDASKDAAGESDVKPKQSERPKAAQIDKTDSSSSLKALTKTRKPPPDSLLELLNQRDLTTKPWPKRKRKPKAKQVQMDDIAARESEFSLSLTLKSPRQKAENEFNWNSVNVQEHGVSDAEVAPTSYSKIKTKTERILGMTTYGASNHSPNRRIKNRNQSDLSLGYKRVEVEAPDISIESVSQSQKKTKELKGLQISLPKLDNNIADGISEEDLWISGCSSTDDSDYETCSTSPYRTPNILDVGYLSVADLRAIARRHKLTGCYKLRKAELAEKLGLKVQDRGEKRKRRKEKKKEVTSVATD